MFNSKNLKKMKKIFLLGMFALGSTFAFAKTSIIANANVSGDDDKGTCTASIVIGGVT